MNDDRRNVVFRNPIESRWELVSEIEAVTFLAKADVLRNDGRRKAEWERVLRVEEGFDTGTGVEYWDEWALDGDWRLTLKVASGARAQADTLRWPWTFALQAPDLHLSRLDFDRLLAPSRQREDG